VRGVDVDNLEIVHKGNRLLGDQWRVNVAPFLQILILITPVIRHQLEYQSLNQQEHEQH
jgi:hypothetical protein